MRTLEPERRENFLAYATILQVLNITKVGNIKRFKEEVLGGLAGQECGMAFVDYQDLREGEQIMKWSLEGWGEVWWNCTPSSYRLAWIVRGENSAVHEAITSELRKGHVTS